MTAEISARESTPARPWTWLLSRRETWWLVVGSLAFATIYFYPVLCDYQYFGPGLAGWLNRWPDWSHLTTVPREGDRDLFASLRWSTYYTVWHFHQMPYWSPYRCGGMPLLADPEAAVVSPYLLLYGLFGLMPGMLLEIWLHLAIAFAGGYVLGREMGLRTTACVALAGMFPSSSWLALHVAAGHVNFLSETYVPWTIALLYASYRTERWLPTMLGGLLFGLSATEGNYAIVHGAMLLGLAALGLAAARFSLRPFLVAALIGVFGLAFAAPKLIPTAELLSIYPRDLGISYLTWWGALVSVFSHDQDLAHAFTGPFFFSEYGNYISAPFAALGLAGILGGWRKSIVWTLGFVLFFALFLGDRGPYWPSIYFRMLPMMHNMGLSGRWGIPLVFCAGMLAAIGAQVLLELRGPWPPRIAKALVLIGMIDAWIVCSPNYRYLVQPPGPMLPVSREFRQYYTPEATIMTPVAMANMGSVSCAGYGYAVPQGGFLDSSGHLQRGNARGYNETGYRGEYFIAGPGEVRQLRWTPNLIAYEIDAPAPTSLVINQNYFPGWRLARGNGTVYSADGLIGVHIPAGSQQIELEFTPTHIAAAFSIAFSALAILILVWWIETRFGRRHSG